MRRKTRERREHEAFQARLLVSVTKDIESIMNRLDAMEHTYDEWVATLRDELIATQRTLGVNPHLPFEDVAERLATFAALIKVHDEILRPDGRFNGERQPFKRRRWFRR